MLEREPVRKLVLGLELVLDMVMDLVLVVEFDLVLELGLVVELLYVLVVAENKLVVAVGSELEAVVSILVMVVVEKK